MGRFTKEMIVLTLDAMQDPKPTILPPIGMIKRQDNKSKRVGKKTLLETQVGGNHYGKYAIQPIEFIAANKLGFIEGCIIKYICRYTSKNGSEDLRKIKHYVDLLLWFKYKETDVDKSMNREELYAEMVDDTGVIDREGKNDNS